VSQVISHYHIIKKLGAGGMGEVYLAEDTKLARKVALKLLLPKSAGDEQARKRLIREARAAARLDHPNICAIHEVGEEANRNFIIMQYVEGETLARIVHKRRLSLRESLDIAIQILSALSEAHSQGIIHRDIKPQNIIVTPRGQVKVLDFGLAKTLQPNRAVESEAETQSILTEAGVVMGTVGYMSPEQARGGILDARSDLFSLGAVLYECVTGRPAFSGNNLIDICVEVIHVDPQAPSKVNPSVPPRLDSITLKALAKEADARYQSAGELLEDLRSVRDTSQPEDKGAAQPIALEATPSRTNALATLSKILRRRSPSAAVAMIVSLVALLGLLVIPRLLRVAPHQPLAQARLWYDAGTNALRDGAYYQASKALERAIGLDDRFALAHARLAEAWTELDYNDKAKDELLRVSALVPDRSALPDLDALYLKAITDTVTREFGSAIESYRRIAERVPDSEKAFAYVDVGRSYEKNEDVKQAIGSYEEAAGRDTQYSAAFLRLGILRGRQQDLRAASEAFEKAQSLYEGLSNLEGVTEVLYQRGALFNKLGKLSEARTQLQQVLDLTQQTANRFQQIRGLIEFCSISYTEGNTERGKAYAKEAVDLARANSLENLVAQSLIDLGGAFYVRREYAEAEKYFRQALELSQANKGRRNEAMALLSLARLYIQQEIKTDEALECLSRSLAFFEQGGYAKEVSQGLLLRGRAKVQKGDYDGAVREFNQQLELAKTVNDQPQVARLHILMGSLLADRELYADALLHFDEGFAIHNSLGNQLDIGYGLIDRANMLWRLGRYEAAREILNRVSSAADRIDSKYKQVLLARRHLNLSQIALSERRFGEAKAEAEQALSVADTQMTRASSEAQYVLGLAQSLSGSTRKGRLVCEQAVQMAKKESDPKLLSNALLAFSEVLFESNDFSAALTTAVQAQERFASLGQQESQWRALLFAGRASKRMKDYEAANKYLSHSNQVVSELQQKWGPDTFASYSSRPDIKYYRSELTKDFVTAP